jgi:hypothetical protein
MNIWDYDWDRLLSLGYSEETLAEFKSMPPSYKKGLTKEEQETAKREIKTTMKKAKDKSVGTKELYKDWDSDKSYNKRNKGKMPESDSTKAYKKMYGGKGESDDFGEASDKGLAKKSKESGIPLGILKKVFAKGMAAWRSGHRPGVSPQQWAMGRVNSFITGSGGARKADADLWKKAKSSKGKKKG